MAVRLGPGLDVQDQEILVGRWCGLGWPGRQFQFGSAWECEEYAVVAIVVLEAAERGQADQVAVKPRGSSEVSRGAGHAYGGP